MKNTQKDVSKYALYLVLSVSFMTSPQDSRWSLKSLDDKCYFCNHFCDDFEILKLSDWLSVSLLIKMLYLEVKGA